LAWLAGQDDLVQAFENKEDVYKLMASRIFNKPPDQIDKTERQIGKVVILGAGYGVGHAKLKVFLKVMAGVEVTIDEADSIINAYRRTYSKIPLLWENANRALNAMSNGQTYTIDVRKLIKVNHIGLTLPNGMHIQYPNLTKQMVHSSSNWVYTSKVMETKVYGGLVVENVCQAVARCIVAEQMLKIANKYKVVLTVHDAIACIAPIEEADVAQKYVEECMSWRPKWAQGLPLACESGRGASYGDC
jgi:DNA polymerase